MARFTAEHALAKPLPFAVLDLASETGEVAKAVLEATGYGRQAGALTPAALSRLAEEIGDALYSLLDVANAAGIDAEAALDAALARYRAHLTRRGRPSSG